ncbi:hypothetical protein COLU111180_04225 [Cohnella lubricantis]|uniref:Uncharacterized protein n=1 Tax=Cohnella lubricantis TaxID=2163172 RepID=A0A841TBU9_9BACL|nr:hypothetical protein [Cohnella lubricantis]MBB6676487.1 hypothetical protein [Cohnella lubricantis]MBP2117104.1 hypothetical protein [Cohnella lubricantis]
MSAINHHCTECGMLLSHPAEYHPYEFCILKKAGQDPRRLYHNIAKHAVASAPSGDYISKKELLEWASNRKSMHRTSMPYDMGIVFMCDSLAAEIISGRFDILSPAEGRYREAMERIVDVMADDTSIRAQRINNIIISALSPIGEQKEDTEK